ncbi:MAG: efflux RND transporter permease subunit [Rheinheimera sp.]|nr:efflux RND transporter permease subunit [Rheinheimera sp.]
MFSACLRHYTLVIVMTLIVVLLSLAAVLKLPVQMIPDLDSKTVSVLTVWPGATPADIEQEILLEQERYLRSLPNLKRLSSEADTGSGWVELEFNQHVSLNEALLRVSNALTQVPAYPENVDQPRLLTGAFSENPFLFYRLMPLPGNPLNINIDLLRDYVDQHIRPQLERVDGVSAVQVWGAPERQVQILLNMPQLAQRGISIVQIRDAIRERNRDASGGDLDEGSQRFLVRLQGRFDSIDSLRQLIVAQQQGHITRLGDVAELQLQHAELRERAFAEQERSLTLAVKRQPGSNVIAIKQQMTVRIDALNQQLASQGLQLNLYGDDVRYVQAAIDNAWQNLLLGALLASGVLYLYLRSASMTLLGMLSIPLSTLTAFAALLLFNRSINVISLAGIAFAIGMTLDNAIVVLESVKEQLRRGLSKVQAILSGVQQVWTAVLASTLSTVLVLVPVLLIEQEAGQLYSDIAIAIMAAILASMAVALLVMPGALALLNAGEFSNAGAAGPKPQKALLLGRQLSALTTLPKRRRVLLVAGSALLLGSLTVALFPPTEYLPGGEEPKAFTRMSAPPGYSLSAMQQIADGIQQQLALEVQADPARFDRGDSKIPPLQYFSLNVEATGLNVLAEPVRPADLTAMMRGLTDWFESYPGMRAYSSRGSIISSNDGGARAVVLDISGIEQQQLFKTAQQIYDAASQLLPDADIYTEPGNLSMEQPMWQIKPNWTRLSETGLSAGAFAYSMSALSDGAYVDEILLDGRQVDVMLYSGSGLSQQMSSLQQQPLVLPNGQVLPLSALAEIAQGMDNAVIRRVDGARTVSVYIIPPRQLALEQAVAQVKDQLLPALYQAGQIAPGVQIRISGAADQMEKTWQDLVLYFALACVMCYLVLVAIFNHWGYAVLIMLLVPTAMAGGVLGLALFNGFADVWQQVTGQAIHQALDMMTMLGFLILLGVVVNNPILIVERYRELKTQLPVAEAIHQAVLSRQRPILMTTMTTVMGLSPLVFIPGAGSEIYRGIGIVLLSGLLLSTLLSLYLLPLLLTLLPTSRRTPGQRLAARR